MCIRDRNYKVVSVIGDGALTGGMAFEALNNAAQLNSNFIIVLNDNNMSLSLIHIYRVNVRAAADTESEKLGTLDQGTVVTRTAVDGDWSVIDYNGTTGYVKNEFLTYDLPDTTAENNSDSSSDNSDSTNSASSAEGTVIMLDNTTNIRSGMSEDSSKVGTAYAGEKVTRCV